MLSPPHNIVLSLKQYDWEVISKRWINYFGWSTPKRNKFKTSVAKTKDWHVQKTRPFKGARAEKDWSISWAATQVIELIIDLYENVHKPTMVDAAMHVF